MKRIVRLRKVDLPGDKKVKHVICRIKGIKYSMSNAILNSLNIDGNTLLGELPDNDLERLKEAIINPAKLNLPSWMFNRQKDLETGDDLHLTGVDIPLMVREDIKRMKETKSRAGFRHGANLKVRGQRTKAHPRRGKTVGVVTKRKAAKMQKKNEPKKDAKGKKGGKKK